MQDTNISWLDFQTSFYKNHLDKIGEPFTFRQILFSRFADHLPAIIQLKSLDTKSQDYERWKREIKNSLACYALNLLEQRKKVISPSGLIQFDFDKIFDYDIEELKAAIFELPFVAFCGTSCSGHGLYAFVKIAEPHRLHEYANHIFEVFKYYHIPIDTSKGRNVNDLRYVSYDCNMLCREFPQPLKIKKFYKKPEKKINTAASFNSPNKLIVWGVKKIQAVQKGQRFETVRKIGYTLGGTGEGLDEIKNAINYSNQYTGEEKDFIKVAEESFKAGSQKQFAR